MHSSAAKYIPVGSVLLRKDEFNPPIQFWEAEFFQQWRSLSLVRDQQLDSDTEHPLSDRTWEHHLLKTRQLSPYARLFHQSWIKLEFKINDGSDDVGTIRVYFLPDDVHRSVMDRSDPSLLKTRQIILGELDYSPSAWNGNPSSPRLRNPVLVDDSSKDDEEEMSLLQLFNTIPSPNPNPNVVTEPHSRGAMCSLLGSSVPGLRTQLYEYQRRSAALMLQKEISPGHVLDPRLLHVLDQNGSSWYLDPVAGTVLIEPRYYDGVSGGILAEEMGSGKTIICLALILATRDLPAQPPEHYRAGEAPRRRKIASLADMAASCATRNSVPWKPYFDVYKEQLGEEFTHCIEALERNPGHYLLPAPVPIRVGRRKDRPLPPPKFIYLSSASLVVVPNNLLAQWKQEIRKHTDGLEVIVITKDDPIPSLEALLRCDLIIFSQTRFEKLGKLESDLGESTLSQVHFKRCIVDEGHKLGNSRISNRSNLLIGLNSLNFSSRWIVTGTPSHGLFGVDTSPRGSATSGNPTSQDNIKDTNGSNESLIEMERKDLERIGSITALFLKARPWANTITDAGDTLANWSTYLMLPKHNSKSRGRWDCLRSTVNTLIIRHRLDEVASLLPSVNERVVVLDGSYQDQMSLNIFSMMIIFNAVQSQRTDMDYFFHPRQRKSLLQIVQNLKQASFFGGSFYKSEEIENAIETAEGFLRDKKVPISDEDQKLLEQAIEFGRLILSNHLRRLSNQFHDIPISAHGFPNSIGRSWSLDGEVETVVCSSSSMLLALQKLIHKSASNPEALNSLLNGQLEQEGILARDRMLEPQQSEGKPSKEKSSQTLAGNTKIGDDSGHKIRPQGANAVASMKEIPTDMFLGPLEKATISSTASAKLSYLIDSIVKFQDDEKIIVFYENENVAWYLASMLDVLQIQHLIYAKGLTTERKAQYVNTFHHNPDFRVLLMDISQAAFGLDMREASRIYFINPVLNPQVEAQAIGRVRRISQQKPVSVETLVLKNSIEEVILERKQHMSQAEHRRVKSILDIRPIYDWIKNAKINPLPEGQLDKMSQMAPLHSPQYVFGRGFGRDMHPDDGLILHEGDKINVDVMETRKTSELRYDMKRPYDVGPGVDNNLQAKVNSRSLDIRDHVTRPSKSVRFAAG
ncbi:P-loop containing nucleoside triphosphate hydrolase protein [Mariannaea sp. PMI_226]|nr:P-loop containing nucleoside triphosphate hydrolase protein [Mariannaea sp. PMI_226]